METNQQPLVRACRAMGVTDSRVLEAVERIARADFVPEDQRAQALLDQPVPIPHHQVTTQPSLSALMVESLHLAADDKVLEVGTGLGWQTAVLASLAGEVWSVERFEDLAAAARHRLSAAGYDNVEVVVGDGSGGLPDQAPFDAILVSAAFPQVPEPLIAQLTQAGRLTQPIGPGGQEVVTLFTKHDDELVTVRRLTGARFVPLVGAWGFSGSENR